MINSFNVYSRQTTSIEMNGNELHFCRLTCTHSRHCKSSSLWCSWAFPQFHKSNRVQWSGAAAPRTLCLCTDRRAARACSRRGRGRRICAEPCCISPGCRGPTLAWVWCKLRRILCGASGTDRPHCTPWPQPGSDSQLPCRCQSLQVRQARTHK